MDRNWINQAIGENIRKYRKEFDVTQEELANELGISRPTMVNIERGNQGCSVEYIYQLCQIFNCTANDLFPSTKYKSKVLEMAQKITGSRLQKCNCPCHQDPSIKHVAACCNNGYIEY